MAQWYYRKADQEFGPITTGQLKQLADSGELHPGDLVYREDKDKWIRADHVIGLFAVAEGEAAAEPAQLETEVGTAQQSSSQLAGEPQMPVRDAEFQPAVGEPLLQPEDRAWRDEIKSWEEVSSLQSVSAGLESFQSLRMQVAQENSSTSGVDGVSIAPRASDAPALPDEAGQEDAFVLSGRIKEILRRYNSNTGLYVAPDIPAKKLANAAAKACVPADEKVLGLIDFTLFGSASDSLIFGSRGLYFHNSTGSDPTPDSVDYDTLANCQIAKHGMWCVSLDEKHYCTANGPFVSRGTIIDILREIRQAVRALQAGGVTLLDPEVAVGENVPLPNAGDTQQPEPFNAHLVAIGAFIAVALVVLLISIVGHASHPKYVAFQRVLAKYEEFPDPLASHKERKQFNSELEALQNQFFESPLDVAEDADVAKDIVNMYSSKIEGRYSGLLPIVLDGHIHEIVHQLLNRE